MFILFFKLDACFAYDRKKGGLLKKIGTVTLLQQDAISKSD